QGGYGSGLEARSRWPLFPAQRVTKSCAAEPGSFQQQSLERSRLKAGTRGSSATGAPPTSNLVRELDDEIAPVGQLHLGQRLRVHGVVLADELVEREDIGAQGIDLLVRQRARLRPRHGAPDVIARRGRVGPEIADGLFRLDARLRQRGGADKRPGGAPLGALAV